MKVAFTPAVSLAKFVEHSIRRRVAHAVLAEQPNDIRLPSTVHTLPAIALEAENAQPAVIGIVPTLGWRAAAFVMITLPGSAMRFAWAARG